MSAHRLSASPVLDSLSNLAASLNGGKDKAAGDAFFVPAMARDQVEAMYRGDWLARKIVDIVPYDCVREWREWHGDPADVARIEATERRLGLQRAVQRAMVLGRLYGGGALLIGTRETDPAALASELRPEAVGPNGIAFLHAVSRWQLGVAETDRDPLSPWFGEPTAYEVAAPGRAGLRLHPSRVIRFLGNPLPDPGLFGAETWSDSVLSTLYDAIHSVALTTTGATSLMHEAKVDVVTVPNLSEHLSNAATTAQLSARFAYAATMKSINNLLLLGDGESWTRQRIDFAGLPEMVRTFLQVAAGAADIPVTRLLGQSPAGLSATGDSDTRNYYDMIAARQAIELRPQLERLDRVLLASAGLAPAALRFEFRPLWQMDATARAAVALQKAQATQIYAGLGLWPAEVMAGLVRGQLAEDGTYPGGEAVLSGEGERGAVQVRDYSPDQPRDPDGRWTSSGGSASTKPLGTELPTTSPIPLGPDARNASGSGTPGFLEQIRSLLGPIDPISPAQAQEFEREENRLAGESSDPTAEIRIERYADAYNALKAIDPKNQELVTLTPPNWVPSNQAIERIETALEAARSGRSTAPRPSLPQEQDPASASRLAPSSEQVNRADPGKPETVPHSQTEEMLERISRENPFGLNVGRAPIPEGAFGSIVRAPGVVVQVEGEDPRKLALLWQVDWNWVESSRIRVP